MQSKYFQVEVPIPIPAVVTIGQGTAFADTETLFNWTSFEMPRGGAKLVNVGMRTRMKGASTPVVNEFPVDLLFSTNNDVDLGVLGSAIGATVTQQRGIVGHVEIIATQYVPDLVTCSFADTSRIEGNAPNMVLTPDLTTDGEEVMYVAGIAKAAWDFTSVCRATDARTTERSDIVVDGVHVTKLFVAGDTLVNNTTADTSIQTEIGVIKSVDSTTAITLTSTLSAAVADNDYIYNKYPITLILSFER